MLQSTNNALFPDSSSAKALDLHVYQLNPMLNDINLDRFEFTYFFKAWCNLINHGIQISDNSLCEKRNLSGRHPSKIPLLSQSHLMMRCSLIIFKSSASVASSTTDATFSESDCFTSSEYFLYACSSASHSCLCFWHPNNPIKGER